MSTVLLPPITATPNYHWTGPNQRRFLERLAQDGVVSLAAKAVEMSPQAAYAYRQRAAGRVFALGWLAAILVSRDRLFDDLMERAFLGQEEEMIRDPDNNRLVRKRIDNRLGQVMLARLDRMVAEAAGDEPLLPAARLVAGDFERFLDLVERDGGGSEAGLFLAAVAGGKTCAFHYQLAENNAAFDDDSGEEAEPDLPDNSPEHEASFLKVWWDDQSDDWRTDFPPPPGFDGDEEGHYGEDSYVRALSDEEAEINEARLATENRPFIAAAQEARDAWFAVDADVQAELDRRAAEEKAVAKKRLADAKAAARTEAKRRAAAERLARKERERQVDAQPEPMEEPPEEYADEYKGAELIQAPHACAAQAVVIPGSGVAGFRTISMAQKPRPLFGIYGDKPPSRDSVW